MISLSAYTFIKIGRGVYDVKASTLNIHSIKQKAKSLSSNSNIILLLILFMVGLIFGTFAVKSNNSIICKTLIPVYMNYVKSKSTTTVINTFFTTLLINSSAIVIAYFIGLCAIGVPFVASLPAISGVFIGSISSYIYQTYMLKGLGYCGIIIFPSAAITSAAIIFASRESMLMSINMLSLLSQRHNKHYEDFKSYTLKFVIYFSLASAGALVEAILTHLFIGLFSF